MACDAAVLSRILIYWVIGWQVAKLGPGAVPAVQTLGHAQSRMRVDEE
jgi:hypothetical protein